MKLLFIGGPQDGHVIELKDGMDPKALPKFVSQRSQIQKDGQELVALYGLGARRNAKVIRARFVGWHKRPLERVR